MFPLILFPSTFGHLLLPVYLQLGTGLFSSLLFTVLILLMAPFIAMPQIYLARALRPLLADAARTEERIKLGEQLSTIAVAISTRLLVVGLISALGMVFAGGLLLLDAFLEGNLAGGALFSASIFVVMGVLLTFYFIHLLRLKANAKPAAL